MSNTHAAIFSDVHIGNNANTCWYQKSIHEPYLLAALNWVAQHADMFQEVVLLGDLVDIWTYPPSVRPPSMADIIAANPNVLGPGGALAKVVAAVHKVTILLGNHDGTLTQADIAALQSAVGPVQLVDAVHVLTGASGVQRARQHLALEHAPGWPLRYPCVFLHDGQHAEARPERGGTAEHGLPGRI
jgi:hypothetical protein